MKQVMERSMFPYFKFITLFAVEIIIVNAYFKELIFSSTDTVKNNWDLHIFFQLKKKLFGYFFEREIKFSAYLMRRNIFKGICRSEYESPFVNSRQVESIILNVVDLH